MMKATDDNDSMTRCLLQALGRVTMTIREYWFYQFKDRPAAKRTATARKAWDAETEQAIEQWTHLGPAGADTCFF